MAGDLTMAVPIRGSARIVRVVAVAVVGDEATRVLLRGGVASDLASDVAGSLVAHESLRGGWVARHEAAKVEPATGELAVTRMSMKGGARAAAARHDDRSNEGGSVGGLTTRVPKRAGLLEVLGRNEASQAAPMTGDLAAVGRGESHDGESRR